MAIVPVQSRWGCAFISFGTPWVAQRVWPIPIFPFNRIADWEFSDILPLCLSSSRDFPIVATPNESYPRYSSFFNPSTSRGAASLLPTYPTIPHTLHHHRAVRDIPGFQTALFLNSYIVSDNAVVIEGKRPAFHTISKDCSEIRSCDTTFNL